MRDRILDFSEEPASLSMRIGLLVIERKDKPEVTIPFDEIAVMITSHPMVRYSNAVLSSLAQAGGAFIVCNEKYLPVGMLLPLVGYSTQAERFSAQANASSPVCKNLWKQIVQAKIKAQGNLLKELYGNDRGLTNLSKRIRSGDTDNIEGQASRRYWPTLFGDGDFRRDRAKEDQNRLLNYGYTVLRAITARAVCGSGLHPSLGIHHHNRYDAFCLADDLMEPFRPIVDKAVVKIVDEKGEDVPLEKDTKAVLIGALIERFNLDGEQRTLFDIISRTSASLAQVFEGKAKGLVLPDL
jgi:CRISPR-associated protein Cas1